MSWTELRGGEPTVYGYAAGGVTWLHLPLLRDDAGAVNLSARRGPAPGHRICAVYEEVLPSARGVFGGGEEGIGFWGAREQLSRVGLRACPMAFLVLLEQLSVRLGLLLQREGVGSAVKAGSSAVDGFRNAPSTAKWICFCGRHSVLCTIYRTERSGGCGVAHSPKGRFPSRAVARGAT